MAKKPSPAEKVKADFENYVRRSSDSMLETMLEVLDLQLAHPDYMNRCWSGSPHNVPITEVITILNAERKRRAEHGENRHSTCNEEVRNEQVHTEATETKPKRKRSQKKTTTRKSEW